MEGFQETIGTNSPTPTAKLPTLRVFLSVVSYRKWNSRVVAVSRAFLKSKHSGREIYAAHPLSPGGNPDARWELPRPLYGSATARKGWYETLRRFLTNIGCRLDLLDKSVFFCAGESSGYGSGEDFIDKRIGVTKMAFSRRTRILKRKQKEML